MRMRNYNMIALLWDCFCKISSLISISSAKGAAYRTLQNEGKIGQAKKYRKPQNSRFKIPFAEEKNDLVCIVCSKNMSGQGIITSTTYPYSFRDQDLS